MFTSTYRIYIKRYLTDKYRKPINKNDPLDIIKIETSGERCNSCNCKMIYKQRLYGVNGNYKTHIKTVLPQIRKYIS